MAGSSSASSRAFSRDGPAPDPSEMFQIAEPFKGGDPAIDERRILDESAELNLHARKPRRCRQPLKNLERLTQMTRVGGGDP